MEKESDGDRTSTNVVVQPIDKDKWSQRQVKQYEVEQRMNMRKKKRKKRGKQNQEKSDTKKRREQKRKKDRLLRVYDRRVQGFYRSDSEGESTSQGASSTSRRTDHEEDANVTINRSWQEFYSKQPLTSSKKEFKSFVYALSSPLPVTLRIDGSSPVGYVANKVLMSDTYKYKGQFVEVGGRVINKVIEPLNLIQNSFRVNVDRAGLIRSEILRDLHSLITREVKLGHFSRQEEASMVPVCILEQLMENDKQGKRSTSKIKILDMCCCPGSKTKQMLTVLRQKFKGVSCLVANDSDPVRIRTMQNQLEKMPFENFILTCERGEDLSDKVGTEFFDYVYADVPCSGDGTFRKAPALWAKWHLSNAFALHRIQVQLVFHALSMLKVGGVLIYSTCSLNPIENEAVITTLIERCGYGVDILEANDFLKDRVNINKGVSSWSCVDTEGNSDVAANSGTSVPVGNSRKNYKHGVNRTFLAPHERDGLNGSKLKKIKSMLERTCRCMPHVSETGGFFVAIIRKTKKFQSRCIVGAKDPVGGKDSISNQNNTPWLSELDQESSLKILKGRMGFQACSSNEAVKGEILYEASRTESKIIGDKIGVSFANAAKNTAIAQDQAKISYSLLTRKGSITYNKMETNLDVNPVDGLEDKPFHCVNDCTMDTLQELMIKQVKVMCAGVPVLTRQNPLEFKLEETGTNDSKISKNDKKRFYNLSEYCFHPEGAPFFSEIVGKRKSEVEPDDFLSLVELFIHNQDTGIPMDALDDYLSPPCAEYLKRIRPGSSVLLYLSASNFSTGHALDTVGNTNAAHESTSSLPNSSGGRRRRRRKKKKSQKKSRK